MPEVLFDFNAHQSEHVQVLRAAHSQTGSAKQKKSDWRSQLFVLSIRCLLSCQSYCYDMSEMSGKCQIQRLAGEKVSRCRLRFTFAQKTRRMNAENVDFEEALSAVQLRKANT